MDVGEIVKTADMIELTFLVNEKINNSEFTIINSSGNQIVVSYIDVEKIT